MVRADQGGRRFDEFKEKSVVAIGWKQIGSVAGLASREAIVAKMLDQWPDWHKQKIALCAGQVFRFAFEIQKGDRVLTYDPSRRVYLVGTIEGDYEFSDGLVGDLSNVRRVKWDDEVSRDLLSVSSKNVLGAISTLFVLTSEAAEDVEHALAGKPGPEATDQTAQST